MTRKTTSKLHPFLDIFVHSDKKVRRILEEHPEFKGPLFDALRLLLKSVLGQASKEAAIEEAGRVPVEGEDPYLVSFFLFMWSSLSREAGRLAEAAALLKRARILLGKDAPPELVYPVVQREGAIAMKIGNQGKAEALIREALEMLPPSSPQYPGMLVDYGIFLATRWRLPEIDRQLDDVVRRDPAKWASEIAIPRFSQCAETGRIDDALRMMEIVERSDGLRTMYAAEFAFWRGLFDLMRGGSPPPEAAPGALHPLALLLAGRPEAALTLVREKLGANLDSYLGVSTFPAFNMVRAELACGHGAAARRILDIRRKRGNRHPLDDFFLARTELLAGDREAAARLFAAALKTIEEHGAGGCLEFELKMSCELSSLEMFRLMRGPGASGPAKPAASAAASAVAELQASGAERLVGQSAAMRAVREAVRRYAPLDAPVLITGETGTGKELVARALHEESPRRAGPFLAVNCGAIVEALLETELFGHERGAFTGATRAHRGIFEQAGSGTVLLDEIGEVTPRLQVALLRVLEASEIRPVGANHARKVSCRIVAATNAELEALSRKGLFRQDLLFRLRRLEIAIPPLRERREDVLPLVDHFLREGRPGGRRPELSPELKAELRGRDWPGNVRELRNEVERMRLLNSEENSYGLDALRPPSAEGRTETAASHPEPASQPAPPTDGHAIMEELLKTNRESIRRLERLRGLFRKYGTMTRAEAMKVSGVSQATATRDLKVLCAEGCIEKVRPNASPRTHYFRLRP